MMIASNNVTPESAAQRFFEIITGSDFTYVQKYLAACHMSKLRAEYVAPFVSDLVAYGKRPVSSEIRSFVAIAIRRAPRELALDGLKNLKAAEIVPRKKAITQRSIHAIQQSLNATKHRQLEQLASA